MGERRQQGPNVRKLICHKMALIMIPPGTKDGLATGIKALSSAKGLGDAAREATAWVFEAIDVVKTAPDNPFADDEAIAGEILRGIEERKRG